MRLASRIAAALCLAVPLMCSAAEASKKRDRAAALPPPSAVVVYKTADGKPLHLYIERPADWKPTDKRTAFVFIHGGGWVGGDAAASRQQTTYFAGLGAVGISVEYRLLARGNHDAPTLCCQDAKSALRYVRAHAVELGIDPNRIVASGGSAGGHLAAFTALVDGMDDPADDRAVSPKPNALVLFNPVLDNGPKSDGGWGNERVGERVKEFSPAHNVREGAPPTIIFLGRQDALIPVATMERFQAKLRAIGTRCELFLYDGQGHGFFNREPYLSTTEDQARKFLVSLGWLK